MDLHTTNIFLGIMAVVSLLEGLVVIGLGVGGFLAYRRVMGVVTDLEAKHVAPLMTRVNAIMDDVKGVTGRVTSQTERVDHAIKSTIDRVDETADRVKSNVRSRAWQAVGIVRGIRTAIETFVATQPHNGGGANGGRAAA
jgi:hypothetical protein